MFITARSPVIVTSLTSTSRLVNDHWLYWISGIAGKPPSSPTWMRTSGRCSALKFAFVFGLSSIRPVKTLLGVIWDDRSPRFVLVTVTVFGGGGAGGGGGGGAGGGGGGGGGRGGG